MRINVTKKEARNAVLEPPRRDEEYGIEDINPRGQAAKTIEMSARRSISLHNAMCLMLKHQRSVQKVKDEPLIGIQEIDKQLKDALGAKYYGHPTWRTGWAFAVDHWWSGGMKRGIDEALRNLPTENRKRVEKAMKAMQEIDTDVD